jgi:hypothetical protein
MGISSAQASLLNVQDDLNESCGVYAIAVSPPFEIKKPLAGGQMAPF